jgi:hypothetical protein
MRKGNLEVGKVYVINGRKNYTNFIATVYQIDSYSNASTEIYKSMVVGVRMEFLRFAYNGNPGFKLLDGARAGEEIRLVTCAGISPSTEPVIPATRKEIAAKIREDIASMSDKVSKLQGDIAVLNEKMSVANRKADMYEKYDTDEQALAAMLAEVIKSGGDEAKILVILSEYAMTNKL